MSKNYLRVACTAIIVVSTWAGPALAADTPTEVLVVGNRLDSEIMDPARQVTVLSGAELQRLSAGASNTAELLSKLVPGMAQASQTLTNYSQTLRGRDILVLIDGVPMGTNRDTSRDLFNIHPAQIERIQVLRGGNAIYGSGASGGVIAITTRKGGTTFEAATTLAVDGSAHVESDSFGYKVSQFVSGTSAQVDYAFSGAVEHRGAFFDAEGDRIAPEPSQGDMFDANILSFSAKVGKTFNDQRLQFTTVYYDAHQDTEFGSDPSVNAAEPGTTRARALEGLGLEQQNSVENHLMSLDYVHRDLAGSELHLQIYHRDYTTRFYPFDAREIGSWGNLIAQTYLENDTSGLRLTVDTPLANQTELVWGLDVNQEQSANPVTVYDETAFDAGDGLVFVPQGDRIFMPEISHDSAGAFAQLRHRFTEQLALDAGVRYERIEASFNDFITLAQSVQPNPEVTPGGNTDYDAWLGNLSLVYTLSQHHEFYAAYNEGFELPDIGLRVRYASADFSLASSELEPVVTDNYELGWRGTWDNFEAGAAAFYNTSELGRVTALNFGLSLERNEERIRGIETSADYRLNRQWQVGGSLTYMEGEERPDGESFRDMNGFRIPPLKAVGHLNYEPSERSSYRLQVLHSGDRDYRLDGETSFGRRDVDAYTTVDFIAHWALVGSHGLTLSVENLMNNDYYPVYAQLLRSGSNTSHIPARGRWLQFGYSYQW